jgi:hypothetical protein
MEVRPVSVTGAGVDPGPGTYLLRYHGRLSLYRPVSETVFPVYVGSARCVRERLHAHRRSLNSTVGLSPDDFSAIVLRAPSHPFAVYAEALLIDAWRPAWNITAKGFGSAGQGRARALQRQPDWVVLHPGREAGTGPTTTTRLDVHRRVGAHLAATAGRWSDDPAIMSSSGR